MSVSVVRHPRFWVERLLISRSTAPLNVIRDVKLRPGLNIVWAKEPGNGANLTSTQRAGHGVGKSTFTLMLRWLLGDDGKAVRAMRHQLASQFPDGGVGAVVHFDSASWSVYRPYATDGFAAEYSDLEGLLAGGDRVPFKQYFEALAEAMLVPLQQRSIPGTGQTIEWPHVLSWISRDQGTRLRDYYDWRSLDGAGLQRSRQDPPWVVRAVLGVTDGQEVSAIAALNNASRNLEGAKSELKDLETLPRQIRGRIEGNLRHWAGADLKLPYVTDDIFEESVLSMIDAQEQRIGAEVKRIERQIDAAEQEIRRRENDVDAVKQQHDVVVLGYGLAKAAADQDEAALKKLNQEVAELRALPGDCAHGGIAFGSCSYIQQRIEIPRFSDQRDKKALESDAALWTQKAINLLPAKSAAEQQLQNVQEQLKNVETSHRKLKMQRDSSRDEISRAKFLRQELIDWQDASGSDTSVEIEAKRAEVRKLEQECDSASAQITSARQSQSQRAEQVSRLMGRLAGTFELQGRFQPYDEERPFGLVGSAGEAYSVLEILLGDFACAIDSINNPASSFPSFFMHDCPREADLSDYLYGQYLSLLVAEEGQSPGWQSIVTTTTPPPVALQRDPYLVLELGPAREDDLLLRARFGLH